MLKKAMDNQPESSYRFPEDSLAWSFGKDTDTKYNTSVVPLAERVSKATLPNMNVTQTEEVKVVALSAMNSSINGNASRGIDIFTPMSFLIGNISINWFTGCSSGEGSSYRQV